MPSPLIIYPESTAVFSPAYYGTIDYYATLAKYGCAVIDYSSRFDKRLKSTHRTTIADVNRELSLTVPIEKPVSLTKATWGDIRLSSHGEWWHVHRVSIESAYGRTPFFEYYIDRFAEFLDKNVLSKHPTLQSLDTAINTVICDILGIETNIRSHCDKEEYADFRFNNFPLLNPVEYYQVRQSEFGFIPHLSILDLIFNMGPEAPLILIKMKQECYKLL